MNIFSQSQLQSGQRQQQDKETLSSLDQAFQKGDMEQKLSLMWQEMLSFRSAKSSITRIESSVSSCLQNDKALTAKVDYLEQQNLALVSLVWSSLA